MEVHEIFSVRFTFVEGTRHQSECLLEPISHFTGEFLRMVSVMFYLRESWNVGNVLFNDSLAGPSWPIRSLVLRFAPYTPKLPFLIMYILVCQNFLSL